MTFRSCRLQRPHSIKMRSRRNHARNQFYFVFCMASCKQLIPIRYIINIKMDKKSVEIELNETSPFQWHNRPSRRGKNSGSIRIYASAELLDQARREGSLTQVLNVSRLPGLIGPSMAMPDIHYGYGFCIGGVAAFSEEDGIVAPGGVGYDINCGVSLVGTSLQRSQLQVADLKALGFALLAGIPSGLNQPSRHPMNRQELRDICQNGARAMARRFQLSPETRERTERGGTLPVNDIGSVSESALQRGQNQLGTLGSGNHFLEIQYLAELLDPERAAVLGLRQGMVSILLHSGSRGLGHQVASEYIALFQRHQRPQEQTLPDPQLVNVRLDSALARRYLDAHNAAANFAWANRQLLVHDACAIVGQALGMAPTQLKARLITDHSHNLACWETHPGHPACRLLLHRKGATRALPAGHPDLSQAFSSIGQAVVLPGSMGSSSFLLCGRPESADSWYSCPHGAGRALSRRAALALDSREKAVEQLEKRDILLFSHSRRGLGEEIPQAYKPVEEVLRVSRDGGLAWPVARFEPLLVIKG